jgi:hypothetical protein
MTHRLAPRDLRLRFGDATGDWPTTLHTGAVVLALLAPIFHLAALTQLPDPLAAYDPRSGLAAWITLAVLGTILTVQIGGAALLLAGRASGLLATFGGFLWFTPMLSAVAIAVTPLASPLLVLLTLGLAGWSLRSVLSVDAAVSDADLAPIVATRISRAVPPVLLALPPGTAAETTQVQVALAGKRSGAMLALELALAALVLLGAPVILPLAITGNLVGSGILAPAMWVLCTAIMLGARGSLNIWILLNRAGHAAKSPR